jgi:hypothetical protein
VGEITSVGTSSSGSGMLGKGVTGSTGVTGVGMVSLRTGAGTMVEEDIRFGVFKLEAKKGEILRN